MTPGLSVSLLQWTIRRCSGLTSPSTSSTTSGAAARPDSFGNASTNSLDAAHILPDAHPLGAPVVSNGRGRRARRAELSAVVEVTKAARWREPASRRRLDIGQRQEPESTTRPGGLSGRLTRSTGWVPRTDREPKVHLGLDFEGEVGGGRGGRTRRQSHGEADVTAAGPGFPVDGSRDGERRRGADGDTVTTTSPDADTLAVQIPRAGLLVGNCARRSCVLDRHHNHAVILDEVSVDQDHPAPRAYDEAEPIPPPVQCGSKQRKGTERLKAGPHPARRVGREAVGEHHPAQILHCRLGQLDASQGKPYSLSRAIVSPVSA